MSCLIRIFIVSSYKFSGIASLETVAPVNEGKEGYCIHEKTISSLNLLESNEVASLAGKTAEFYASQCSRINSP
jgi:hypothetical protein